MSSPGLRRLAWLAPAILCFSVAVHQKWRMARHEQVAEIGGGYGMFSDHHRFVAFAFARDGSGWAPLPASALRLREGRWAVVAPTRANVEALAAAVLARDAACPVRVEIWRVGLERDPLRVERRLWRDVVVECEG